MPTAQPPRAPRLPEKESLPVARWFLRRGLGSMVADTAYHASASRRAAPALVAIFLLVMFTGVPAMTASPVVSFAIVVVAVLAAWAGGNLLRRRPAFARIDRIGWTERAVFVLVPVLAVLVSPHETEIFEDFVASATENRLLNAAAVAVTQIVLLALVLGLVNSGIASLSTYLSREVTRSFLATSAALARTLPLLLGVVFFFFFTAEMWQSIGRLDSWAYALVLGSFVALSGLFLSSRDQLDIDGLSRFADDEEIDSALEHTPFAGGRQVSAPVECPVSPAQDRSLRLVAAISRLVVAGVVGVAVLVFFLVFAIATTNVEAIKTWIQGEPNVIATWATSRHTYALTWEQVRVSGFLAVFSGFYYAVVSATDPTLREGVKDTAEDTVREACAARLEALARSGAHPRARSGIGEEG
ncbi:MAG TPA: hypothetical protein PLL54_03305 [Dermatophilaceae bacterium]|nr:hypothetical protein [Dermatophilaceae bacterium]